MAYFEGCLPVEEMAKRGRETLRFGPMKPIGLHDPRDRSRTRTPSVQLRREDRAGQMWNLVGFQTRLRIPEQQRVFRRFPGSRGAEFLRYGSHPPQQLRQCAGVARSPACSSGTARRSSSPASSPASKGYTESLGTGLLAGINLARVLAAARASVTPPPTTMLGGALPLSPRGRSGSISSR